jgi:transposase
MRTAREVLRLRLESKLSVREVAASCKVSVSTISEYEKRLGAAGLSWPLPEGLDDAALERIVRAGQPLGPTRPLPPTSHILKELRKPHVTLQLLWMEYRETSPDGYGYTQFCHWVNQERKKVPVTLRQEYKAGEKLFTDYAGDTLRILDPLTGELNPVYLFVSALGASSCAYAEGVLTMDEQSWTASHVRAFEFYGGAPRIIVPDNTKCAVTRPDRYEPDINPSFAEMAAHYGAAVIPARVRKPRDKAKVEAAVLLVERWILAALRNRVFHSIAEVNEAIRPLLDKINAKKMKRIGESRAELFEKLDKPALSPLPATRYTYGAWKKATVNIDYHVCVENHFYSAPYRSVRKQVDVRISASTVEICYKNRRIAGHQRSRVRGGYTTNPEHMPASHREYLEWSPSRIIRWAASTGPQTARLVEAILESKPHPEQGYRSCLGIIRLEKDFGKERVEAAANRALAIRACSYQSVKSILKKGLDARPLPTRTLPAPTHANVRGADYYRI